MILNSFFRVCVGGSLSECAQWNVMAAPPLLATTWLVPILWPLAWSAICVLERRCLSWHFVLSFSSISATFGCLSASEFLFFRIFFFGLHCMSHVALELKTRTRARARWASLSFRSPLRPSDKVLSYDLLKCPNAAITRDYYKCIRRVQRIRMRHIRSGALEQKKRQTCQVKWIGKEGQGRQLGSLATGNKLFWPPTNKWNPKSHSTPAAPTPLRCQGFWLPSSWAPGHRFSWVPQLHEVALHAKES